MQERHLLPEVQLQSPSSAQEESQAGVQRDDKAIPEVGSPFSHGGRGGERCRDGSPERVFGCEGGPKAPQPLSGTGPRA